MDTQVEAKRKRGQRGLGKRPRMVLLTVRLPQDVADYYRSKPRYTTNMRNVLIEEAVRDNFNGQN